MPASRQRSYAPTSRLLAAIFVVATLVNYAWELAQSSLYVGGQNSAAMWWHCFIASLGDGLILLLIFSVGRFVFGTRDWFVRPGIRGYALMCGTGLLIAIAIEWFAVHVLKTWSYAATMPVLFGVGILPIVQMIVLPALIFKLVSVWKPRDE